MEEHGLADHGPFPSEALACLKPFQVDEEEEEKGELREEEKERGEKGPRYWSIPEEEILRRRDLRSTRIFTIDPTTAKDLDDALHITPLVRGKNGKLIAREDVGGTGIGVAGGRTKGGGGGGGGGGKDEEADEDEDEEPVDGKEVVGYEIGVHIADVSYFLLPLTALDEEAARRCTSIYLVQKVLPMLPRLLCEQLCSLNPRFVISLSFLSPLFFFFFFFL